MKPSSTSSKYLALSVVLLLHTCYSAEQNDWQQVAGSQYHFSVYSAYYILGRLPSEIVVIGTTRTFSNETISCRIYFRDDDEQNNPTLTATNYIQIPGTIETMKEHWKFEYAGVFIRCPFSGNVKPEMVSMLLANQTEPSNMIKITNRSELKSTGAPQYDFKFSVCVHPVYQYNEVFHLIEWIEFYKMMGVEQFTLYNVSIGPEASCILHDLMEGNDHQIKMNVYPWHENPIKTQGLIRGNCAECALSAGSNDCLYRHRGRVSEFMVFVDLDEYIMPRGNAAKNYSQLIDLLDTVDPEHNIGHYLFRNGFFIRKRPDDPLLLERCSGLQDDPFKSHVCKESFMMSKVWREEYNPFTERTKYIIKPEAVNQTGTHVASFMEPGYNSIQVSEKVAFSRHYRHDGGLGEHIEIDRVSQKFGMELVDNIASAIRYYKQKCKI